MEHKALYKYAVIVNIGQGGALIENGTQNHRAKHGGDQPEKLIFSSYPVTEQACKQAIKDGRQAEEGVVAIGGKQTSYKIRGIAYQGSGQV